MQTKMVRFFMGAAVGVVLVLLGGFIWYSVLALGGRVQMTLPIFFGMLLGLAVINVGGLLLVWRRAPSSSLVRLICMLWGGIAAWYWTFAPLYYVLNMNLNEEQLAWTAFSFLWEVPVIGGGFLTTIGVLLFLPIARVALDPTKGDPEVAYRRAVRYPSRIALLLFVSSVAGYVIGAVQLYFFAGVSWFELIKSVSNGPVVAVFLAVFFYLTLDAHLDDYRRRLSRQLLDQPIQVRSVRYRLALVSVAVMLGSVGLLGLLAVQSMQRFQDDQLRMVLQSDLPHLQVLTRSSTAALNELRRGIHGDVQFVSASDLAYMPLSRQTREFLQANEAGVVRDLHTIGKMLAFATTVEGERIISIAYLTDFYALAQPLWVLTYGSGSLLVVGLTVITFMFVAYELTRSLESLGAFARQPTVARWGKLVGVHTGDEIEAVGRTFLRYVQKAEEADQTKRDFVSIASHQLRTPLTAIQWYVELLSSEREGVLTEKQREDLARIARGSRRMTRLINNLLNVSRLDSGRLAIRLQPTRLVSFVQTLIDEVSPQATEVQCDFSVQEDMQVAEVTIDQLLLRQVLHNLFTNAIKYRSPDRACRILVRLTRDQQDNFVLTVQDQGVGIPQDEHHRVFEKFWRARNVATLDTDGTGLGLYVSKMLLEAAGCHIAFASQEGKGTTFTITIPASGMLARPGEIGLAVEREELDKQISS